jgi:pimeloyl-ACP methyl ester carboxylesterase
MLGLGRRNGQDSGALQPGIRMSFCRAQMHTDTVVFVHGILGHYVRTWGLFPQLLCHDPDLPELDVLLWGYRTGLFHKHHELRHEGNHLLASLATLIRPEQQIILVGHSMGGLVILRGLVDRMAMGHAQTAPCSSITWITLFATPLNGAWVAGAINVLLNPLFRMFGTLHRHLTDLSRGTFCDGLIADVVNRIYRPGIEDNSNRRIPIRIVAATRDRAVEKSNRDAALSVYRDPAPLQLDEDHSSVKLPTHVGDLRYRALFNDIQTGLTRTFRKLCARAVDAGATAHDREMAFGEILQRYKLLIRSRVERVVQNVALHESAERELLLLMALEGADRGLPPFDTANHAMMVLARRHKNWR